MVAAWCLARGGGGGGREGGEGGGWGGEGVEEGGEEGGGGGGGERGGGGGGGGGGGEEGGGGQLTAPAHAPLGMHAGPWPWRRAHDRLISRPRQLSFCGRHMPRSGLARGSGAFLANRRRPRTEVALPAVSVVGSHHFLDHCTNTSSNRKAESHG